MVQIAEFLPRKCKALSSLPPKKEIKETGCTNLNIHSVDYLFIPVMLYDRSIIKVLSLSGHSTVPKKTKFSHIHKGYTYSIKSKPSTVLTVQTSICGHVFCDYQVLILGLLSQQWATTMVFELGL
jgi:hypothetical protein